MSKKLFGTDGVRGLANETLTAELALDLSVSAAHVLAELGTFEGHRPLAVVGRDTRISGQSSKPQLWLVWPPLVSTYFSWECCRLQGWLG